MAETRFALRRLIELARTGTWERYEDPTGGEFLVLSERASRRPILRIYLETTMSVGTTHDLINEILKDDRKTAVAYLAVIGDLEAQLQSAIETITALREELAGRYTTGV